MILIKRLSAKKAAIRRSQTLYRDDQGNDQDLDPGRRWLHRLVLGDPPCVVGYARISTLCI